MYSLYGILKRTRRNFNINRVLIVKLSKIRTRYYILFNLIFILIASIIK